MRVKALRLSVISGMVLNAMRVFRIAENGKGCDNFLFFHVNVWIVWVSVQIIHYCSFWLCGLMKMNMNWYSTSEQHRVEVNFVFFRFICKSEIFVLFYMIYINFECKFTTTIECVFLLRFPLLLHLMQDYILLWINE